MPEHCQLFHITPSKNYHSILEHGLLLSCFVKRRGRADSPRVFLGNAQNFRERLLHLSKLHNVKKFDILTINTRGLDLVRCFGFWVSYRDISPNRISHLISYSATQAQKQTTGEVTFAVTMANYGA